MDTVFVTPLGPLRIVPFPSAPITVRALLMGAVFLKLVLACAQPHMLGSTVVQFCAPTTARTMESVTVALEHVLVILRTWGPIVQFRIVQNSVLVMEHAIRQTGNAPVTNIGMGKLVKLQVLRHQLLLPSLQARERVCRPLVPVLQPLHPLLKLRCLDPHPLLEHPRFRPARTVHA